MTADLRMAYEQTLKSYLQGAGERALEQAYELGRELTPNDGGLLHLARIHTDALTNLLPELEHTDGTSGSTQWLNASLSPFQMTLQGFREARRAATTAVVPRQQGTGPSPPTDQPGAHRAAAVKQLVDHVPTVLYALRLAAEPEYLFVSPQMHQLLGHSADSWTTERCLELMDPQHRADYLANLEQSRLENTPFRTEYRLWRHDTEQWIWIRDEGTVRLEAGGAPVIYGFMLNLSERHKLEHDYLVAQRLNAVGKLASGVAHDFNNMLTVIQTYTSFLLANIEQDSPLFQDVEAIRDAADRSAALTRQLLAFTRRQPSSPEVLSPNEVIKGASKLLERLIGEQVRVKYRLEPEVWSICIDTSQFEQVLLNLVLNARDAMPNGGELTIGTQNVRLAQNRAAALGCGAGDYAVLQIRDTGVGMDEQVKQRMLEPFYTTKQQQGGTGLGLPTVHDIVTQNHGTLDVQSTPGAGTTFWLYFPREQQPPPAAQPERLKGLPTGSEMVLVVEDDDTVRAALLRILAGAGYRVLDASEPHIAMTLCERHGGDIDLLIADRVMPLMSGPQLAQRARQLCPNLKVALTSGHAATGGDETGSGEADAFVSKPFSAEHLLHAVRQVLGSADQDG